MIEFMSKKKSLVIYTMFLIVLIYGLKLQIHLMEWIPIGLFKIHQVI